MDEELTDRMLALWLQNSEDNSRTEGLGVEDDSDLELAIRLQQEEYDQAEPQVEDRHIVQSDGQAISRDASEADASVEQDWVRYQGVTYPQSQLHQFYVLPGDQSSHRATIRTSSLSRLYSLDIHCCGHRQLPFPAGMQ